MFFSALQLGVERAYSHRFGVLDSTSSPPSSGSGQPTPLIGRVNELKMIAQARIDGMSGVVVRASAGTGKSRLARAALAQAEPEGAVTAWVQATRSAASVPLGAFAGVITAEVRSDEPFELLRRSVQAMVELAGPRPLVVGVDDAQLLDPTSAALVLQLASTAAGFVVATIRSGESCPDAIVSLWKDAGAHRLELAALNEDEIHQLVESIVGGPVEERAHRWIWESSAGNALYARELVLGVLDGGALQQVSGLWRMPIRPLISTSLAELISARMAGLANSEQRLLELLALGEPLRLAEVLELTGSEELAAAEARALISIEGSASDADVRLSHPLYGDAIRAALPSLRAREVRSQLAATIKGRGQLTPEESLRVAVWLMDAGEQIPERLLIAAASAANLSGDPDLGAKLAERAVRAGAGADAALLLARAHLVRKRFSEAESVLAGVEGDIDDPDTAIKYLDQRTVSVLYWGLRRPDDAQALLERARDWWSTAAWLRRLDPLRLHLASLIEGFSGAVAVSAGILADQSVENEIRRQMEPVHAVNLFYSGRVTEAYELINRIRPAVPLSDYSDDLALTISSPIAIESGHDLGELERVMGTVLDQGLRARDRAAAGVAALALGAIAFLAGRYVNAARMLAEAELHFEHQDAFGALVISRANQVGVARYIEDAAGAGTALQRCLDAVHGEDPLPNQVPYVALAQAWAAEAEGRAPDAQQLLLDVAERLSDIPVYAARLRYEAMRAGAPAAKLAASLSEMCERCDARLVSAYAAHCAARAAGEGATLLEVAAEFERIGTLRYACEAAAHAAGAFLDAGRHDSARRAAARSRELFVERQGAVPPAIDGLEGPAVELSPREAQLVEMAKRGLSNMQIAEQLVLSRRTVESHLYRAMQKLGISDRREL